jgi:Asp-tRNA(Asn)/Glu-tRNA(Gln) amidotransferase A subunit family amidase
MDDRELAFTPAWRLREMIGAREVSPVELTELYLRRIDALNPKLNAYLTVDGDRAMADARKAEAAVASGGDLPPLHGVPIGIKDLTETEGLRTTNGSALYKDYVPKADELTAARIRASGAIILGKTNTPEFGHSATTENMLGDAARNPWDTERTPGGSSGGTAAGLAAGLHPIATGSDGGGSIRIPASLSGVFGIKPTQGRVARPYHSPGGWRPFSCNGPMSNDVRDAAILLEVMAGPDPSDPPAMPGPVPKFTAELDAGIKGMQVGWSADLGGLPVDPEVRAITEAAVRAFAELGASVEVAKVDMNHRSVFETFDTIWVSDLVAGSGKYLADHADEMSASFREQLERGVPWPASRLALALRELEWHRARTDALVTTYDLLVTPTTATAAFPIGQRPSVIDGKQVAPWWGFTPFAYLFNMSGHPAASIPCGFTAEGLPVALHVVGHHGAESTVLRACAAFERARPWIGTRPAVS